MRYRVTILRGYPAMSVGRVGEPPGVSYNVVDTLVNHALLATYRSEDYKGGQRTRETMADMARIDAYRHVARLNGDQ